MISDVYFPRINGVSTSIATFRRSLARLGHECWLIAPRYPNEHSDDPHTLRIASRYLFLDPEDRMLKRGAILELEQQLREQRFDLIHIQTPFIAHHAGKILAQRLGLPLVETYHTYFEEYLFHYVPLLPKAMMRAVARGLTRSQCQQTDAVIVPSRAMHEVLKDYGVKVPMAIIPTGLELDEFSAGSRQRSCQQHDIDPARPILVHVGRVAFEKNIGFLLEVVARARSQFPELLLIIAGEGPAEKSLHAQARKLGITHNIKFIGYLSRGQALWDCYCSGDACVFASSTETQGLVLLEAMALGVPVVSTAVMGTRDILDAGRGALVAEQDVEDFAAKVTSLLQDEALRQRLAQEARDYARQWATDRMAQRLLDFYAGVVDKHAAAERPVEETASPL